mmetsp:Transcript_45943/g.49568  ORF Transcript_45943/g.49568 Transcript_45943/m.49568 type:complete len:175 (+) Transcript_45943:87-611(+)
MSKTNTMLYNTSPFSRSNAISTVATTTSMMKNSLTHRLYANKQTNDDRSVHPASITPVTPVNSDEECCNASDQSSDSITVFEDYQQSRTTSAASSSSSSQDDHVHCNSSSFFPVPEQIMVNLDTYTPLSPEEVDEDQLVNFFTGLGEDISFLIKDEEEEEQEEEGKIYQTYHNE